MKQKLITLLLALVSIISAHAYDIVDGIYSFNIISEEDATVSLAKATAPTNTNAMDIPSSVTFNGKKYSVVKIDSNAIYNISYYGLDITIPSSITRIDASAITGIWYIYGIYIENSEEPLSIGKSFLNSCSSLEDAHIGRQIIYDDDIASTGFSGKSKLKNVNIEGGYHNINAKEFQSCTALVNVSISTPIYSIGDNAFYNTPNLDVFFTSDFKGGSYIDSCTEMGDYVFSKSGIRYAIIPNALKEIPAYAFANCPNITSLAILPESAVESIGKGAFKGCVNLQYIRLSKTINLIKDDAFNSCSSLKTVDFLGDATSPVLKFEYSSSSYQYKWFENCPILSVSINREVFGGPFHNIASLKHVEFGEDVTKISESLFYGCGIETLRLPSNIKQIDIYAFYGNENLSTLELNDGLESIGFCAFSRTAIETLTIPSSVTTVDLYSFNTCPSLKKVIFEDGNEELLCKQFENCPIEEVYLGRTITDLPSNQNAAFTNNTTLTKVSFGNTVTRIPMKLFSGCTNLRSVDFSTSIESIGYNAFNNCTELSQLELPNSLKSIEDYSFSGCTAIKTLVIPGSVTKIWVGAFKGCSNLNNLIIEAGSEELYISQKSQGYSYNKGEGQFFDSPLKSVIIKRNLTYPDAYNMGYSPFAYNSSIEKVEFQGESVSDIGGHLFAFCPNIKDVNISSSVESIWSNAFYSCTGLESISWGEGLKNIGDDAFSNCNALSIISSNTNTPPTVGARIFSNDLYTSAKLEIPQSSIKSYLAADTWKEFLNIYSGETLFAHTLIIDTENANLKPGESIDLHCTLTPEDASNKTLIWSSSDNTIASVNNDGVVVAHKSGNATINATTSDGSGLTASCTVSVELLVSGISLNETDVTLSEGQSTKLVPSITPELADNKSLEWSSSNPSVATVDQEGNVTAIAKGNSVITVKSTDGSDISASCNVTVVKLVSGIVLNETDMTLPEGQSAQLTATVSPELANNKLLTWSSSNEAVATVDQEGKVTAVSKGNAVITVSSTDGSNVMTTCNVTVVKLVSSVVLNETNMTLSEGQSVKLTATVSPELADNKILEWSSSNTNVASVDQDGNVTAIAQGNALISVKTTDGSNIIVSCNVTVQKLVSDLILNETEITLHEGQKAQLIATVSPELADNKELIWITNNGAIASVTLNGEVTAHSQGTAIITVKTTDGSNLSATCKVNVVKLVTEIVLNQTEMTLPEGQSAQLTATVNPELADNKVVEWSSSNETVATVDQNGNVTAIAQGSAVITAKSTDGSNIATSCYVTVVKLVSGITLNETDVTLNEGTSAKLIATVAPELADNKSLEWSSNNENVATVDQNGNVTAIAQGNAIVTVRSTDGSDISASCNVTVVKLVESITLSDSEIVMSAGEYKIITATVNPENATNKALIWTSSDNSVARVENGIIVAVADGEATITVATTDGSEVTATCDVIVRTLVSEIILDKTNLELKVGEFANLSATVLPSTATNSEVEWTSSDATIASVQNGLVLAHAEGEAIITVSATDGSGVKAECKVTISKDAGIESVTWDDVKVYVSNSTIYIDNLPTDILVRIIQTNGSEIFRTLSVGERISFQPSDKGVYFVILGNRSYKVAVL